MVITKTGSFTYDGSEDVVSNGGSSDDRQISGSGNDSLGGGFGNDYLDGGSGRDKLFGHNGNDQLYGGEDKDTLYGSFGNDVLYGSSGDDDLYGDYDNDTLLGESGGDRLSGDSGNDLLIGGFDNDILVGGEGIDTLFGGEDNDGLLGKDGTDYLYGGEQNDSLFGEGGDDYLHGEEGDDALHGNGGNDSLYGGNGNDTLYGSLNNDEAVYSGKYIQYNVAFTRDGSLQVTGSEGTDLLYEIERIRFEVGGYAVYAGDAGANNLTADPNFEALIYGGDGNDSLTGSNYEDTLTGGNGSDTLKGGNGYDIATYFGKYSEHKATFTSDGAVQITGSEGPDLLSGIERITFAEGAFYNVYTGDAGGNNLTADPNVWSLLYGGDSNDNLTGSNLIDLLDGGNGNDTLNAGAGDDTVNGYGVTITNNGQIDQLTGGAGSDIFVLGETGKVFYNEVGDGYGVIRDWNPKNLDPKALDLEFDRIQLAGNATQYKLEFTSIGGIGTSAQDTNILFKIGAVWERIGIIQDSINVDLNRDFVFV